VVELAAGLAPKAGAKVFAVLTLLNHSVDHGLKLDKVIEVLKHFIDVLQSF
jgi:hypothetical protein